MEESNKKPLVSISTKPLERVRTNMNARINQAVRANGRHIEQGSI